MKDTVENPAAGAPIPINQNGVKPGPKKLEQFRLACRIAGLPDEAKGQLKDDPEKGRPYMARLRLFNPTGVGTWLLQDWNSDDNIAFGWAHLGDDNCAELGYISLEELATHKGRFEVGIEIDNWFRPMPMNKAIGEKKTQTTANRKKKSCKLKSRTTITLRDLRRTSLRCSRRTSASRCTSGCSCGSRAARTG